MKRYFKSISFNENPKGRIDNIQALFQTMMVRYRRLYAWLGLNDFWHIVSGFKPQSVEGGTPTLR